MSKVQDNICRACISVNPLMDMISLHNEDNNPKKLFVKYINLPESAEHMLPRLICKECYKKLTDWHEFVTMCNNSYKSLLKNLDVNENYCTKQQSSSVDKSESNVLSSIIKNNSNASYLEKRPLFDNDLDKGIIMNVTSDNMGTESSNKVDHNMEKAIKSEVEVVKAHFVCEICNKKFYKERRLIGHIRQHQGLKPAVCHVCNKEFTKWGALDAHIEYKHKSTKNEIFSCDYPGCSKSYFMKQTLESHKKKTHSVKIHRNTCIICDICGKSLATNGSLKKHKLIHSGQMPFQCNICLKKLPTRHKLKEHIYRHEGIKNFVCSYCGLKKTTAYELKKHINIHTKENLFPCKLCTAVFSNIGNVQRHYKTIHCGIKPFLCTYCDKSFGKAETLKHHIMTHTGEKPHCCNICGKRFIQFTALQTHMKVHLN